MTVFEPFEEGVEVNGQAVMAVVDGVPAAFEGRAREMLAEEGIEDLDSETWYPQDAYLDAYRRIADRVGDQTLRQIGRSIPTNAEWPPGVDGPLAGLESLDEAYQLNHRGGEIGSYDVRETGDDAATVRCRTPYPCVYDQGILTATAERFADGYAELTEVGDDCREHGAEACTYRVEW
jgi:hypothetical protein